MNGSGIEEPNGASENEFVIKNAKFQALSEYMNVHNYGKNDYDEYAKDVQWQKLHMAAFPDFHQITDHELTEDEKIKWVNKSVPDVTKDEAKRIAHAMRDYTGNRYSIIHEDSDGELQETKDILRVFDSKKVQIYKGVIYRGLSFESRKDLAKTLGISERFGWNEPGITSFSADKTVAEDFATRKEWGLVLICSNNKSAIPFRHMSASFWEDEVLSPGSHRNNGWTMDKDSIVVDEERHIMYAEIKER